MTLTSSVFHHKIALTNWVDVMVNEENPVNKKWRLPLWCLQFLGVLVSLDGDFRDSALCVTETENPERDLSSLTVVTL